MVLIIMAVVLGLVGVGVVVGGARAFGGHLRRERDSAGWFDAAAARLGWEAAPSPPPDRQDDETLAWPERVAHTVTEDGWRFELRVTGWHAQGVVALTCALPPAHAPLQPLTLSPRHKSALAHHTLHVLPEHLIAALFGDDRPPARDALLKLCSAWSWTLRELVAADHQITLSWTLTPNSLLELWLGDDLDARVARAAQDGAAIARELAPRLSRPEAVAASLRRLYTSPRVDEGARLVALYGLLDQRVPAETDAALLHVIHHLDPLALWAFHEREPQLIDPTITRLLLRTLGHEPLSSAQLLAGLRLICAHATADLIDEAATTGPLSERLRAHLSAPHPMPHLHTLVHLIAEDARAITPTRWIDWLGWLAAGSPDIGEATTDLSEAARAAITDHALASLSPPDDPPTIDHAHLIRLLGFTGDARAIALLATLRGHPRVTLATLADHAHLRLIDRLGRAGLSGGLQLADDPARGALSVHERAGELELLS